MLLQNLSKFYHKLRKKKKKGFELYKHFALEPYHKAKSFADTLNVDLDFYKMAKFAQLADSKDYFLYSVMRTVKKTCLSLLHKEEFVSSLSGNKVNDNTLYDEMIESMMDDINFLIRKLVETLVNVICFSKSDKKLAYIIFLNAENLDLFQRKQSDFKLFHEIENLNVNSSIKEYYDRISKDMRELNEDLWFINNENFGKNRFSVFKSISIRYQAALLLSTNSEKILLGETYEKFISLPSLSIHSSISAYPMEYSFKSVQNFYIMISLLCDAIINRSRMLAGIEISEQDSIESEALRESADKLLSRDSKYFRTGDIVLVHGDLAEILETIESKFGYKSYKVRYLNKPPISTIPEDYYPSKYIVELILKNDPHKFLEKIKKNNDIAKGLAILRSKSKKELYEALKLTLIDLDKKKLLQKALYGS